MSSYVPRTTRTGLEPGGASNAYYWVDTNNPYAVFDPSLNTYDLCIPNCTCYCFGRALEMGSPAPHSTSSRHNALAWHAHLINGWTAIPYNVANLEPGDIVEWSTNGNHVATVEEIIGGVPWVSQSFYRDTSGGYGYRDYTICGSTQQSVWNWFLANYPDAVFNYNTVYYAYGQTNLPDYILKNPKSFDDGTFKFFITNKGSKKRRKIYV